MDWWGILQNNPISMSAASCDTDITRRGVVGDPTLATPDKGRRFFDAAADRLAQLLISFATWTIEDGVSPGGAGAQNPR